MSRVTLGDVVYRAKEFVDKAHTDLKYYVGGEHFEYGQICITQRGRIEGSTIGPAFHMKFAPGDVLLMSRNPHLRKAGVVDFEGICSDVSYVCRTRDPNVLLQEYLPFVFQTDAFWSFAEEHKHGSTNYFLNWKDFELYEFELPEIEQQQKLTEILWAAQRAKQSYKKLIEHTDALVKSQFIEMFGLPERNCHGYDEGTIADVVQDVHYGTSSKATDKGQYTYLRMNNITYDGQLDLSDIKYIDVPEKDLKGCLVRRGDVLFNRTNSRELVGKTCAFMESQPMVIAGYIIRLRMNGKVLPEYLSIFMNLKRSKDLLFSMAKGAVGQANINAQEVQSIPILIPPMNVQLELARLIEQSDKSKFELRQAIERIDALIKSLMQQYK